LYKPTTIRFCFIENIYHRNEINQKIFDFVYMIVCLWIIPSEIGLAAVLRVDNCLDW